MSSVGFDLRFFTSRDGILKLLQFILSLLILIVVSATNYWRFYDIQEVYFTGFTTGYATVTLLISIVLYIFKLYSFTLLKKLPWKLMEIFFNATLAVFYFISMAICGSAATKAYTLGGNFYYNSFFASAILCAAVMIAFTVHTFLIVRSGDVRSMAATHQATTVNT